MYFIFNNIKEGSMNVNYLMINLNKFLNCLVGDCVMKWLCYLMIFIFIIRKYKCKKKFNILFIFVELIIKLKIIKLDKVDI